MRNCETASRLTQWNEPYPVETLAAAYAETGDFESAVKWQTKAIALFADETDRKQAETMLTLYNDKKPYRDEAP